MNRDGLLGRPRVGERLLPVEIAALDKRSELPPKRTVKPASKAERVTVQASAITWRWRVVCPKYGFKASGEWRPRPGATAGQVRRVQAGASGACTRRDVQLQRVPVVLLGRTHASLVRPSGF